MTFLKGQKAWNKGLPHSEETRRKISDIKKKKGQLPPSQLGYKHTDETKARISESLKGNERSKGKKWNEEARRNITKVRSHQEEEWGKWRNCVEYKDWRMSVFRRDNFTCQVCLLRGDRLQADHIKKWADFPELRFELSNGRTLCESCHKLTPNYGNRKQLYG